MYLLCTADWMGCPAYLHQSWLTLCTWTSSLWAAHCHFHFIGITHCGHWILSKSTFVYKWRTPISNILTP